MTACLPLFEPRSTTPATDVVDVPSSETAVSASDIKRIITHKAGPLFKLGEDGRPSREFEIIERTDGLLLRQYTDDGERELLLQSVTAALIEDAIRNGIFVEREV